MVQLQVISKAINEGSLDFIVKNGFTKEYFFEFPDEFDFIVSHARQYGNVPDVATFLAKFPEFEVVEVRESDSYLSDKLREEMAFHRSVPIIEKAYKMLEGNAFDAIKYLQTQIPNLLRDTEKGAVDLVKESYIREQSLELRMNTEDNGYVGTGFKELDEAINGWKLNGDLAAIIARPGVGKTWVLLSFLTAAWREGYTVGLYSGEMPAEEIGNRFDTLVTHVSNSQLEKATIIKGLGEYKAHLAKLRDGDYAPFYVVTQEAFGRRPTVSDLENFAKAHNLDILGIDQYTLMGDERATRDSDTKDKLEHISSDLRLMALRNHIAILAVNQSNRNGARPTKDKPCPGLEDIYGSDAIGQNSTKVISIGQLSKNSIALQVAKNRGGPEGDVLTYLWDIDHGTFTYQPDAMNPRDAQAVEEQRAMFEGGKNVF